MKRKEVEVLVRQRLTSKQEVFFRRHFRESFEQSGESQRKLAYELGVTPTTVGRWLTGESYPRRGTYDKLVAKYHWRTAQAGDSILQAIKPYIKGEQPAGADYSDETAHRLDKLAPYIERLTESQYFQLKDALRRIVSQNNKP